MTPQVEDRRLVLGAIAAAVAVSAAQLALIGRVELTFDEAYYTLWSRDLAWGYLDHPPGVAAWIHASTAIFGGSEFGVRALNVLVLAAMPALIAGMAWRLYGSARVAAFAALLWVSMPMAAGAPLATPDAPLVVFWTIALYGFVEVWRGRAAFWGLVGTALGLALLTKFTAAFLGAGIALALLLTPSLRRWVFRPGPYLAAGLALLIVSPFLIWNAQHDWATFAKQLGRVPARGFAPGYLLEFLGAQFGLANPLILVAAAASIGVAFKTRSASLAPEDEARRLLMASLAPAVAYFLLHSLHDRVQGNWTAPLYPALAILAADAAAGGPRWARRAALGAVPIGLAVVALAYLHAATAWPDLGPADPMARFGGWRALAREVDSKAHEERAAFILARGYAAASLLTYYGEATPPVLQSEERRRWAFQPPPRADLFAASGLAFGEADRGYAQQLGRHFRTVEEIARLERRFGARDVGDYALYRVADPIEPALDPE